MKEKFFKNNWTSAALFIFLGVFAAISKDILIIIAAVIFLLALINQYRVYDYDEYVSNDWWNALTKDEKKKMYDGGLKNGEE